MSPISSTPSISFSKKEVDEMIMLDTGPEHNRKSGYLRLAEEMAADTFIPMMLGGNISTVEHVDQVLPGAFSFRTDRARRC